MKIHRSIDIETDPARIWEVLVEVQSWPAWMGTDARVKRLDEGPLRLGSGFRVDSPTLGTTVWKVSKWDPHRSLSLEEGWLLMKTLRDFEVEALGPGQSRATLVVANRGPLYWPINLAQLLFRPSAQYIELDLQTLKRVSEH